MSNWEEEIQKERNRQDKKWGGPHHDDAHSPGHWTSYIMDQVEKLGNDDWEPLFGFEPACDYRQRLVKIAALCKAAAESYDRTEVHNNG